MTAGPGADDPVAQFSDPGLIHNYPEGAQGYQPGAAGPGGFYPESGATGVPATSAARRAGRRPVIVLLVVVAVLVAALVVVLLVR
jgi:hypothetical protein